VSTSPGLDIVDISDPLNPILMSSTYYYLGYGLFVFGNYLYSGRGSFQIIDVSDPSNPIPAGSYNSQVNSVFYSSCNIYICAENSFIILKVNDYENCYEYLPGDINMNLGIWPPLVIGGDVTYLSHYFMGMANPPCLIDGFWASADVNGDCVIMGSDNVKLVRYMKGLDVISWCPDYEPIWQTQSKAQNAGEPVGWPNCE